MKRVTPMPDHHARATLVPTHDEVLDAALAIADEVGLDGVTLRRLAHRLGVNHMVPQRMFGSKGELLAALANREADRAQEFDVPEGVGAGEVILRSAVAVRRWLLGHPSIVHLVVDRPLQQTFAAGTARRMLLIVLTAGFPDDRAWDVATTISSWTAGYVGLEVGQQRRAAESGPDLAAEVAELRRQFSPGDRFDDLVLGALERRLDPGHGDEHFQFGLWALYQGLRLTTGARAELGPPPSPPPWPHW